MSFSTLMVHVDIEHDSEPRIELAISLADRFQLPLSGLRGTRCGRRSWQGMSG